MWESNDRPRTVGCHTITVAVYEMSQFLKRASVHDSGIIKFISP